MSRTEEFPPDGHRIFAKPQDIVDAWLRHTSLIPPQYALGTAQHETNFTVNEKDTEESGFVSLGIYQISAEEMAHVGMPEANPLDLEDCTIVFAKLQEERWKALTDTGEAKLPDLWAYIALAHNQGLAAALKTVRLHGMDWAAYKARNPQLVASIGNYGDDCISGGAHWKDVAIVNG